jgi:hypothetical protein
VIKTFRWTRPEARNSCPPKRSSMFFLIPGSINRKDVLSARCRPGGSPPGRCHRYRSNRCEDQRYSARYPLAFSPPASAPSMSMGAAQASRQKRVARSRRGAIQPRAPASTRKAGRRVTATNGLRTTRSPSQPPLRRLRASNMIRLVSGGVQRRWAPEPPLHRDPRRRVYTRISSPLYTG